MWVAFSAEDARPPDAVAAAEAWVLCPCQTHADEAGLALKACQAASFFAAAVSLDPKRRVGGSNLAWAAESAATAASEAAACAANTGWWAPEQSAHQASFALAESRRAVDPAASVRSAIQDELLPWALGLQDPLLR